MTNRVSFNLTFQDLRSLLSLVEGHEILAVEANDSQRSIRVTVTDPESRFYAASDGAMPYFVPLCELQQQQEQPAA